MDANELALERRGRDRRVVHRSLYYPERRTGFDRRMPSRVTAVLRDRPVVLLSVLIAINLLSIADWLLTMRVLEVGAAEGNPVLAAMISTSPTAAFTFKLIATLCRDPRPLVLATLPRCARDRDRCALDLRRADGVPRMGAVAARAAVAPPRSLPARRPGVLGRYAPPMVFVRFSHVRATSHGCALSSSSLVTSPRRACATP